MLKATLSAAPCRLEVFARVKERPHPLGRSCAGQTGRDQPPRRWTRRLLRGSERPPAGSHHATLRQRRLGVL